MKRESYFGVFIDHSMMVKLFLSRRDEIICFSYCFLLIAYQYVNHIHSRI